MEIETYKGFVITLDVNSGKFCADFSRRNGSEIESTSLKSIRTKINEFIKENQNFGEFKIRPHFSGSYYKVHELLEPIIVKGLTANKRLAVTNHDGKSYTFGKYDINRYVMYSEKDSVHIKKCIKLYEELASYTQDYNKLMAEEMSKITEVPLIDFLKTEGISTNEDDRGW